MKKSVRLLSDLELDVAVLLAIGAWVVKSSDGSEVQRCHLIDKKGFKRRGLNGAEAVFDMKHGKEISPSNEDWIAGSLMDKYNISTSRTRLPSGEFLPWSASIEGSVYLVTGKTRREAALRALVEHLVGPEIDVDELLKGVCNEGRRTSRTSNPYRTRRALLAGRSGP